MSDNERKSRQRRSETLRSANSFHHPQWSSGQVPRAEKYTSPLPPADPRQATPMVVAVSISIYHAMQHGCRFRIRHYDFGMSGAFTFPTPAGGKLHGCPETSRTSTRRGDSYAEARLACRVVFACGLRIRVVKRGPGDSRYRRCVSQLSRSALSVKHGGDRGFDLVLNLSRNDGTAVAGTDNAAPSVLVEEPAGAALHRFPCNCCRILATPRHRPFKRDTPFGVGNAPACPLTGVRKTRAQDGASETRPTHVEFLRSPSTSRARRTFFAPAADTTGPPRSPSSRRSHAPYS